MISSLACRSWDITTAWFSRLAIKSSTIIIKQHTRENAIVFLGKLLIASWNSPNVLHSLPETCRLHLFGHDNELRHPTVSHNTNTNNNIRNVNMWKTFLFFRGRGAGEEGAGGGASTESKLRVDAILFGLSYSTWQGLLPSQPHNSLYSIHNGVTSAPQIPTVTLFHGGEGDNPPC